MTRARTLGLLLLIVLTACPSARPGAGPSATPTVVHTGGTITVAYPNEPATLDPFTPQGDTPATRDLVRMLMPGLYRIGPDGKRALWLLASEPVESQGPPFSVTVTLRPDARWSDGAPITTADLMFTWSTAIRKDRTPIGLAGYDHIARIVAMSSTRARIEFRSRFARWRDLFSAGLGVLPSHALRGKLGILSGRWPVSGGPFVLQAWHKGLDMVFVRNPRAWAGRPNVDRIRVVFVPDDLGALELLRQGRVDVLGPYVAPDWTRRVSAVPQAQISTDQGETWIGVVMNTRSSPLADVRVRRAFADALDRQRMVAGLIQRDGALLDALPPSSATPFARYGDIKRARSALARAGWSGTPIRSRGGARLTFTLAVPDGDSLGAAIARAIQYNAVRAGIDVEAISVAEGDLYGGWLRGSRFEAAILIWRDPPQGAVRARFGSFGSGSLPNVSRLTDRTLDDELATADRGGSDGQARVADLLPVLPIATLAVTLVGSARVHGLQASAEADGPFWNAEAWSIA